MTPPDDEPKPKPAEGLRDKLGGWFQKALGGDKPAPPAAGEPPAPAGLPARPGSSSSLRLPGAAPARGSGALPGPGGPGSPADDPLSWTTNKPLTGPLPGERAMPGRAPGTGDLAADVAGTGELPPAGPPPAAPGPAAAAEVAPATPSVPSSGAEDPAAASRRRMAFIVAYMKDPTSDRDFADKPLVYRIMSEERDHQQAQVGLLQEQLRRLAMAPADDADAAARREELEARLKTAQNRQSQLFLQLKKLTGVNGKTGGTGFLVAPDLPPGPPVLPAKPEPKPE